MRSKHIHIPYPPLVILFFHLCEKLYLIFFLLFPPPVKFLLDVITFSLLTILPSHTKYSPYSTAHFPCTFESLNVSFAFHSMFKIQVLEMEGNHGRGPCNKWEIVISVLTPIMGIQHRKTTFIHPAQWET